MANDINNVTIIGRVTKDAELKYLQSGTAVINISIAVNESIKQHDGNYADTPNFFEVQIWGKTAEGLQKYLTKGRQISILGKLKQQTWTDNQTGQNRSKVLVNAQQVQLLSLPQNSGNTGYSNQQATPQRQQNNYQASSQGQFNGDGFQNGANGFDPPPSRNSGFPGPESFNDDIPF